METNNKSTTEDVVVQPVAGQEPTTKVDAQEPEVYVSPTQKLIEKYKSKPAPQSTATKEPVYKEKNYQFLTDLSDLEGTKKKLTEMDSDDLQYHALTRENDLVKWQRIAEERKHEIDKIKSSGEVPADKLERLQKLESFVNDLKANAPEAIKKYKSDFELPDVDLIQSQANKGDINTRLKNWQETTLVSDIEKKFDLEKGEFVFDYNEAYTAGTPSYEFRKSTEEMERQLANEQQEIMSKEQKALQAIVEQRDIGVKWLQENYYKDSNEEFVGDLTALDSMYKKMQEGNFTREANPFAIENIFRGIFFDKLVERAVKQHESKIHEAYNKRGLYLPSNEMPMDVTKIKGDTITQQPEKSGYVNPTRKLINKYKGT